MQFSLKNTLSQNVAFGRLVLAAIGLCLPAAAEAASADSAYIQQAAVGSALKMDSSQIMSAPSFVTSGRTNAVTGIVPFPELVAPKSNGANFAQTVTVGNFNGVAQIQAGRGDASAVAAFGSHNNVDVIQGSNNLVSNVVLVGSNLNAIVLQPPNSGPVNELIARLPNGSIELIAKLPNGTILIKK